LYFARLSIQFLCVVNKSVDSLQFTEEVSMQFAKRNPPLAVTALVVRDARRRWSPPSLRAQVIARGDFCKCRVSHDLRAWISSLSLVYSVWKTNRDSPTEGCPPPHARRIEFHNRISWHRFEKPRHCHRVLRPWGHRQFPSPVYALAGHSMVVLQNCSGFAEDARMD
jgi:hypothetical protein